MHARDEGLTGPFYACDRACAAGCVRTRDKDAPNRARDHRATSAPPVQRPDCHDASTRHAPDARRADRRSARVVAEHRHGVRVISGPAPSRQSSDGRRHCQWDQMPEQ